MGDNVDRWRQAQAAERAFWEGSQMRQSIVRNVQNGLYARTAGRQLEWLEREMALRSTSHILEVGSAAIGVINYMNIGERWAVDPLALYFADEFSELLDVGVQTICGVGEALPFPSEYFNIVLCGVLNHVIVPERLLHEVWRTLAPGGILLLSTVVHSAVIVTFLRARENVEHVLQFPARKDLHFYSVRLLHNLLTKCQFSIVGGRWEKEPSILPSDEMWKLRGRRWEVLSRKWNRQPLSKPISYCGG